MDLSIIIVSWKVKEQLRGNLQAIFNSVNLQHRPGLTGYSYEVFVVDNDSQDGTAEMVREEFSQVKLVANKKNYGFAYAVNQVLREAVGDFVLMLNPDMAVQPETLSIMIKWLSEHPQASVAGCKLVDRQGKIVRQVRRFPQLADQLAIIFKLPHIFPKILDRYLRADFNYEQTCPVETIRGSFFMIRQETIKQLGLLDERYFLWFEEVDYCRQIQQVNGQVWYVAEAQCLDQVGQSFQQVKTITSQRYFRNSMIKYFQKWQPARQAKILQLAWFIVWPFMCLISLLGWKGRAKT